MVSKMSSDQNLELLEYILAKVPNERQEALAALVKEWVAF